MIRSIEVTKSVRGLQDVSDDIQALSDKYCVGDGLCTLAIQHTSASLLVQENTDPSARRDLENWLERLVPENDPLYSHTIEGPDDMPAHIKSMLTQTTLSIPVVGGRLALGTWQGVYLWEHRTQRQSRSIVVHLLND